MRKRLVGVCLLLCCLLLSGCASLLDREYSTVEKHTSKYRESGAGDTLRAESYQDVVNDLLLLVSERREEATLRLYGESRDAAADLMERAAAEVKQETAMGSYAVEYITARIWMQYGNYGADVRIAYRRSEEQMNAVVNATSTVALGALLDQAAQNGREELAVRIGYWEDQDYERVEEAITAARERWGKESDLRWVASYYPAQGDVGLIEFRLESVPEPEKNVDENKTGIPAETPAEVPAEPPVEVPGEDEPADGNAPAAGEGAAAPADGEAAPETAESAAEPPLTVGTDGVGEVRPEGLVPEKTATIL